MVLLDELVLIRVEEVLYLGENQNMVIEFVCIFGVVVLAFGVFAFDFDGGIWDYRLWSKVGKSVQ